MSFGRYYGSSVGAVAEAQGFYGASDIPLGVDWVHNLLVLLQKTDANNVGSYYYHGKTIFFKKTGGTWDMAQPAGSYKGAPYQLVETGAKLRMLDPDTHLIYSFDISGMTNNSVRQIETIQDRNGNIHTFTYNPDATLRQITDGLGRSLEFAYVTSGSKQRIASVKDQAGRAIQFGYSGAQLRTYTDARGRVTTYTYNSENRLESVARPAGNVPIRNNYDGKVVVSQADALGNTTRFTYSAEKTVITDPTGNVVTHQFNAEKRWIGYTDPSGKSVQYGYDSFHRRTSTVDRLGDRSSRAYDLASGKVISRTDSEGNTWRYTYSPQVQEGFTFYNLTRIDYPDLTSEQFSFDAQGNLLSNTDRAGKIWKHTHNSRGQVLSDANPEGGVAAYTYNADGTLASQQDPAGNTTTFGYDAYKRLSLINRPDGTAVRYTYDLNDNLLARVNEKGKATTYTYDDNNNLRTVTDPLGKTWTLSHDANDNLTVVTDPLGKSTTYTYDALERIKTISDGNGNVTTYNYDSRGRVTSIADAESKTLSFSYDDEGVPVSSTNPLGRAWRYSSDKQGRIKSVTDPLSNQTRYQYDALSRLISRSNPLNETTTYGYDARGLLQQAVLPDSTTTSYTQNDLGRITRITDPRGKIRRQAFDNSGRLLSSTDPLGNITRFNYDARNRPKRIELPLSTLDLAYDAVGLLTGLSYSDGTKLDYSYDDVGKLTSATGIAFGYDDASRLNLTNSIVLNRDAGGRMTSVTLAKSKTVTYGYDRRDLLTSVTDWAGGTTRLTYDEAGRLVTITRPNGVVTTYSYDNADRLTSVSEAKGANKLSSIALTKDSAGQTREAIRDVPLEPSPVQGSRTLSYNDADQIAGYSYDPMGRLVAGGERAYKWDLASRLVSYTEGELTAGFTYDAFGSRLTRSISGPRPLGSGQGGKTRSYIWNYALGLPSISVIKDDGATARYYVHTPGGSLLYSLEATNNARRFYHYDEMGSTLFLTDDNGTMTDSYAYSPYGQLSGSTGTSDNPFTFLGQYGVLQEPSTSLYYMRARYYDSATGRFLSRDPVGVNLLDPKSMDLYQYAAQNPLRYVDPLGTDILIAIQVAARVLQWLGGSLLSPLQQVRDDTAIVSGSLSSATCMCTFEDACTGQECSIIGASPCPWQSSTTPCDQSRLGAMCGPPSGTESDPGCPASSADLDPFCTAPWDEQYCRDLLPVANRETARKEQTSPGGPIPAGFFDPGSQPFQGRVLLGGTDGGSDTAMGRLSDMLWADSAPPCRTPVELVNLNLVSCEPLGNKPPANQNRVTPDRVINMF
ncbi:MAG: RHS repeat protein [Acidobacteria bacterium]|nr:RHS repeat protein [Acidobacteriota bacterium]